MTTTSTGPRRFSIGDVIPGHGTVITVSTTAYQVSHFDGPGTSWVPFYGRYGVDTSAPVEGFVTFADGSRYGGR